MNSFTLDLLYEDDIVVYLYKTISSGQYKFIGQIVGFTDDKVIIRQLSRANQFVTPEECVDYGEVSVDPSDVVHVIISRYQEDSHTRMLKELNDIIAKKNKDIKLLIGRWFCALEDEGVDPWTDEECITIAKKYWYTEEDYKQHLSTIV